MTSVFRDLLRRDFRYDKNEFETYLSELTFTWFQLILFPAILLVSVFSYLDYLIPGHAHFWPFLLYRGLTIALMVGMLVINTLLKPYKTIILQALIVSASLNAAFSQMTVDMGGFSSTYYAGIVTVIIGINTLMPWHPALSLINGVMAILIYLTFNILQPHPFILFHLANNIYFLSAAVILTSSISFLRYRTTQREFELRSELVQRAQEEEINEIVNIARKVASGDLTVRIDKDFSSNAGMLALSINLMIDELFEMLIKISSAIKEVASFSTTVTNDAQTMKSSFHKQEEHLQKVMDDIRTIIVQIADNSELAANIASTTLQANRSAHESSTIIRQSIGSILEIKNIINNLGESISRLEQSSDKVESIINFIKEIADESHLLALNASIEAARAGEHGAGFAVVASHIRKMSEQTFIATKDTIDIIKTIRSDIEKTADSMKTVDQSTSRAHAMSDQLEKSVSEIVTASQRLEKDMKEITELGNRQISQSRQITSGIEDIIGFTTYYSQTVDNISQVSSNLDTLVENLQQTITRFKLPRGESYLDRLYSTLPAEKATD